MKKIRVMMSFALAVFAAAAFAVPASASGVHWTKEGEPLSEPETIELNAPRVGWAWYWDGTYYCPMRAQATLLPGEGADAEITDVEYNPWGCVGTGTWAGCELKSNPPVEGSLHVNEWGDVRIDLPVSFVLAKPCYTEKMLYYEMMEGVFDYKSEFSGIAGEWETDPTKPPNISGAFGKTEIEVTPPETYGIAF